jgi:hypothetical protein
MKKIKIMLLTLSVVAVVGAALAFKTKSEIRLKCGPALNECSNIVNVEWILTTNEELCFRDTYCTTMEANGENCTYATIQ